MQGFLCLCTETDTIDVANASLISRGWRLSRRTPSAALWIIGDLEVRDVAGGWVLGALYERGSGRLAGAAPPILFNGAERVCRRLLSDYWGRYVSVMPTARAAFRDPSGHLEAVAWTAPLGWIVASQIPDGLPWALSPPDLALDWQGLALILRDPVRVADHSGLKGVSPIAPGAMTRAGAEKPDAYLWTPGEFTAKPHASYQASRDAVASAVQESLVAETSGERPIVVEISGGVDSAIVATTVASHIASDRARYLNFHIADAMGDERPFARVVAAKAEVSMLEIAKPELVLDAASVEALPQGLRPSVNGIDQHYDAGVAQHARLAGADRILTGQGGDMVFFQAPSPEIAQELWGRWARKPRADPWWRQLEAAARWNGRSVWSLLGEAVHDARKPPTMAAQHPWLDAQMAPAKLRQVRMLTRAQVFHGESLRGRQARLVHPLLHQPVLEAVLAAPIIDLARGGRGRSLVRDAFAEQLPAQIARRRSKGDLTAYYGRMILRSLPFLSAYLIEGRLVQEGLIDRQQIEAALDADRLIHAGDYPRLFQVFAVETFVRHWEDRLGSTPTAGGGAASLSASQGRTVS